MRTAPRTGEGGAAGISTLVIERDTWRLYETFSSYPQDGGKVWKAGSGAVFDLNSNKLRPAGWTSGDAAGLPILPGLLRYDEANQIVQRFTDKMHLPLVAVDGTMKRRLNSTAVAGQAHIKTGSLTGVRAIAGYVLDAKGRTVVVVCLINHPNTRSATAVQDALVRWIYDK